MNFHYKLKGILPSEECILSDICKLEILDSTWKKVQPKDSWLVMVFRTSIPCLFLVSSKEIHVSDSLRSDSFPNLPEPVSWFPAKDQPYYGKEVLALRSKRLQVHSQCLGYEGQKRKRQQPVHSHCVLLDLVYFSLYKIYRGAKNAKQSTVFR